MAGKGGYTPHQAKIINRYYEHRDTAQIQRLGELISELYLATSPKKADQLWKRAAQALDKCCDDKAWMTKALADRNLEQLAALVNHLAGSAVKPGKSPGRP